MAQANDLFLPGDNCERTAISRVRDCEFDGFGADVYRREFQWPETLGKFCYSQVNCN